MKISSFLKIVIHNPYSYLSKFETDWIFLRVLHSLDMFLLWYPVPLKNCDRTSRTSTSEEVYQKCSTDVLFIIVMFYILQSKYLFYQMLSRRRKYHFINKSWLENSFTFIHHLFYQMLRKPRNYLYINKSYHSFLPSYTICFI